MLTPETSYYDILEMHNNKLIHIAFHRLLLQKTKQQT
jgi:hypothetical protein